MRKRMWLGAAILLAGICVLLYPHMQQMRQDAEQQRILASLAAVEEEEVPGGAAELPGEPTVEEPESTAGDGAPPAAAAPKPEVQPAPQPQPLPVKPKRYKEGEAVGTIEIPKIDARLPIVEGITDESLKAAVGHFPGTSMAGQTGNASYAGHRSYKHGKMFNRLDEVEIGDTITLTQEGRTYTYKVTEKFVVEPTEVSVLKQPKEGRYLTLVTCTPIRVASHRLIVKAEMIS